MAIINGPFASKSRGKAGEVVFAKTTGNRTAMRSYQPKVKNPNTLRQRVSRNKLAMASALAAVFSEAVKIGFAKASAGTKMYPRNMFVKSIVPVDAGVFTVNGETITVVPAKIRLSSAVGIGVEPHGSWETTAGDAAMKFTVDNANEVVLPAGSTLGLVLAVIDGDMKRSFVTVAKASEGVEIPMERLGGMGNAQFAAFYKEIPEALNGVSTDAIPWKYPSLTGPCSEIANLV